MGICRLSTRDTPGNFTRYMKLAKLLQIYEDSSNGLLTPERASNHLTEVCEYAIMLDSKVRDLQRQIKQQQKDD